MNVKSLEYVARSVATPRAASNALAKRDTSWILTAENAVPVVSTHLFCQVGFSHLRFGMNVKVFVKASNTIVVKRIQIKITAKLCASKRLRFEDTRGPFLKSPENFSGSKSHS